MGHASITNIHVFCTENEFTATPRLLKAKIINETLSVLAPYKIQIDAENIIHSAITPFNKQINRIQLLKKGLEVYEHANYAIC